MNLELKKAIDQISKDKGLERDMLIDTLEDAVRTSVIRKYGEDLDLEVRYNDDTGDIEVYQFKFVVDDVANELTQIDLEEARKHDPSVQLDDEMGFRLKVEDLGRIAAQSAKQVIIQRMRDAESFTNSTRNVWAKSSPASCSGATRAAGWSDSAARKRCFRAKSRSRASITSAATVLRR